MLAMVALLAVCSWSQHVFAAPPGGGGGTNFTTVCDESSTLDADGKMANSSVDDSITIKGKLKTRNAEPLVYTVDSTVSNPTGFAGGSGKIPLVINPDPDNMTFDGFLVPVDANCARTSDPIMASFNGGAETRSLDGSVDGNVANANATEDIYKAVSAVAGFPTSAWDDDQNALYTAVCNEVKLAMGDPVALLAMQAAGDVGIVTGAQGQTLGRCLNNSALVTYVGAPEGGCTAEEVAAASNQIDSDILDLPSMGMTATSEGSGQFTITLTDPDDCTATVTLDISNCSAPVVDNPCSN